MTLAAATRWHREQQHDTSSGSEASIRSGGMTQAEADGRGRDAFQIVITKVTGQQRERCRIFVGCASSGIWPSGHEMDHGAASVHGGQFPSFPKNFQCL